MYYKYFAVRFWIVCAAQTQTATCRYWAFRASAVLGSQNNVLRFRRFRFRGNGVWNKSWTVNLANRKKKHACSEQTTANRTTAAHTRHIYAAVATRTIAFGPHEQGLHRKLVFGWFKIKWCSFVFLMAESIGRWKANRLRSMWCLCNNISCVPKWPLDCGFQLLAIASQLHLKVMANCHLRFRTRFTFNFYLYSLVNSIYAFSTHHAITISRSQITFWFILLLFVINIPAKCNRTIFRNVPARTFIAYT